MSQRRHSPMIVWVAAAAALGLAVVSVRVWWHGRAALAAADEAMRASDVDGALEHERDAARMYLPWGGPAHRAVERLLERARAAERTGDDIRARRAYEAVRAAALGARSFYTPHRDALLEANQHLLELYAKGLSDRQRAELAVRLRDELGPRPGPAFVALMGCALWMVSVWVFVRRGLDGGLRLIPGRAWPAAVGFVAGLVLFVVGLHKA